MNSFAACKGMQDLVDKKEIDLELIQSFVDSGYLKLYAANCMPKEINYWIDKGNHYTIETVYYCDKCGKYYYVGFCLYGRPIIKEITKEDALRQGKQMGWGCLGIYYGEKIQKAQDSFAESVIREAEIQLKKTNIYYENGHAYLISKIFDNTTHFDMEPHIETYTHSARLYTYERGKCIYEFRSNDLKDVVYYILYDVITTIAHRIIQGKYTDVEGSLRYTDDIRNENKQLISDAFENISGIYEMWYKSDRTTLNM
ncbi:immunity protein 63 of polymorphic toxin system [Mobilisporobacter senegalensis]|uniref:Immunity protein 63 of polymorphic toxin system n=2 Tax=Mobilisporobacter senegalensis TaxID=1329262 RepID=A0A3N1XSF1_9FIRM|nr:Imm63 family immunity protein [Mobilisporobacter senegalensis]ROR29168.1 immunity protein 63 of polymorphic toxin system [Mobilisporobacter senegalensis]